MNRKYFLIRLITLPLKLSFMLVWINIIALISVWKWLIYGGQDFVYFKEYTKGNLEDLIKSNEELVKTLKDKP